MRNALAYLAAGMLAATLLGCSDNDSKKRPQPPALPQQVTDTTLTSFDDTPLALTLFQPELAAGQTAPILLHSHGWGGNRTRDLVGTDLITAAARRAWESGYFVISFDARGFGESGGQANLQDPALEGQDVRAIIDWAQTTFGAHVTQVNGDPRIGALGVSYAGGMQLVGSIVDPRIDAIVPAATWHDLASSLVPNGVPKSLWLSYLYAGGVQSGHLAPWLDALFTDASDGSIAPEQLARLSESGWSTYCSGQRADGLGVPPVDAFFIQGLNDTLFNANQAIQNFDCLRNAGQDAYLLLARGGHLLPELQAGTTGDFETEVQCGDRRYPVDEMIWTFLDGKLRGQQASVDLPRACLVLNDSEGLVTEQVPVGSVPVTLQADIQVGPPAFDAVLALLGQVDAAQVQAYVDRLPTQWQLSVLDALLAGSSTPELDGASPELMEALPLELMAQLDAPAAFIALHTAPVSQVLAGVPVLDLQITGDASLDPRLFAGIGIQRAGASSPELLHEQVTPVAGTGNIVLNLSGVSTRLQPGDQAGVLLYGYHPQYARSYSRTESLVSLLGTVSLPLQ